MLRFYLIEKKLYQWGRYTQLKSVGRMFLSEDVLYIDYPSNRYIYIYNKNKFRICLKPLFLKITLLFRNYIPG